MSTRLTHLTDEQVIQELLVALVLDDVNRALTLTLAVVDRDLVAQAEAAAIQWTAHERKRRGQ